MFTNINDASISWKIKKKIFFINIIRDDTIKKSNYKSINVKRFATHNAFMMIDNLNIFKKKNKDLSIILLILIVD